MQKKFRCAVLSVVKHDYLPHAAANHPRFEVVVVADDEGRPAWTHERNQLFADGYKIQTLLKEVILSEPFHSKSNPETAGAK